MSLVEVMIAVSLGAFVVGVAVHMTAQFLSVGKMFAIDRDVTEMQSSLRQQVGCKATLDPYRAMGEVAPGTAVTLRTQSGRDLTGTPSQPAQGIFAGTRVIQGNWFLSAVWDGTSIEVRAALKRGDAWLPATDPRSAISADLDFASRYNPLFGNTAAYRLCTAERTVNITSGNFTTTFAQLYSSTGNPGWPWMFEAGSIATSRYQYVISTGCARYCAMNGYTSGWVANTRGANPNVDASGVVTSWTLITPPSAQLVGCECSR